MPWIYSRSRLPGGTLRLSCLPGGKVLKSHGEDGNGMLSHPAGGNGMLSRQAGGTYLVALLWIATGAALSTRIHLVFSYDTQVSVTPAFEILAASNAALLMLMLSAVAFPFFVHFGRDETRRRLGLAFGLTATLPIGLVAARCLVNGLPDPALWEVVWYAAFTGLAFCRLSQSWPGSPRRDKRLGMTFYSGHMPNWGWQFTLIGATTCAFGWWLFQSHSYYQGFRLGFNDFGHFTQRIANTAAGRGFLLETPVLPIFWDHFNPGLALLVPAWWIWPSVYLVFALQSLSLALPALLLASIVLRLGGSHVTAMIWGLAWLLHPSIGQMNIAYTYGWHPVTVAVPLLLLAYRLLLSSKYVFSALATIVACSFEEGVIVVVGCFAAAMFLRSAFEHRNGKHSQGVLGLRAWIAVFLIATVSFGIVYSTSGLATFQTGRFARLGGSALEIVMSPILKPTEFWGLLFRARNAAFLSLLFIPFLVAGIHRSPWHLLAVALPIGVLVVWEHLPAQSIAFQYAACLLPVLFLGCVEASVPLLASPIAGAANPTRLSDTNYAIGSLATGWVLCLFVGQMPWSQETLIDVLSATYDLERTEQRLVGSDDNTWLTEQIEILLKGKLPESVTRLAESPLSPRALATGRIASHLVGLSDVETVGQFWQRRDGLSKLDPSLISPLLRYDIIVLDFREVFQQTAMETARLRDEALRQGFRVQQNRFDIQILMMDHKF